MCFYAVTTQREAIIFFCRGYNLPHNNATTFFSGEIQLHLNVGFIVLVRLLNDTENLMITFKVCFICLHLREYIMLVFIKYWLCLADV